jgi:hypothetical protein
VPLIFTISPVQSAERRKYKGILALVAADAELAGRRERKKIAQPKRAESRNRRFLFE